MKIKTFLFSIVLALGAMIGLVGCPGDSEDTASPEDAAVTTSDTAGAADGEAGSEDTSAEDAGDAPDDAADGASDGATEE